ncbi:MAG: DMT family transporter [Nevskiaceae bacterium]|nr:MAG: DMT family transporter [Nevskiaceae bacterium]TBR73005.1 MAG: DMT family transporter [Nevskiaceae bacterium]
MSALVAALLFGAGTPLAKMLLGALDPWLLAGLLYLGSGLGMSAYRIVSAAQPVRLSAVDLPWLAAAVAAGGVAAPVLLMIGLAGTPASGASLLLNLEGVFTALLAWFAFRENFDRRIALGMVAIVAGAAILSWPGELRIAGGGPTLAILAACLCWGLDNNFTRKVSLTDASWIAAVKGLVSGTVNLILAAVLGTSMPKLGSAAAAMVLGVFAYGISLALFVIALRHLGTARTGAYFSVAPFFGAVLALTLGEPLTLPLATAGLLMGVGVWLHLSERHEHEHTHEDIEHEHEHMHDAHHEHEHESGEQVLGPHRHRHRHQPVTHWHPHYPDSHHRHPH